MNKEIKTVNGWQQLPADVKLPMSAIKWTTEREVFRYKGDVVAAFYKGEIETTKDWIIVTDDAGFYKHRAKYMVWSVSYVLARWSIASLKQLLQDLFSGNKPADDPDYET